MASECLNELKYLVGFGFPIGKGFKSVDKAANSVYSVVKKFKAVGRTSNYGTAYFLNLKGYHFDGEFKINMDSTLEGIKEELESRIFSTNNLIEDDLNKRPMRNKRLC